jgi:glucoamylase
LRALIYLNVSQQENGGFAQNSGLMASPTGGESNSMRSPLPFLLAWRLRREKALQDFDPYTMVLQAAAYLVRHGPLTPQERREEVSGYSPSTLVSNIAALICAAYFARERGEEATAKYLEEYADFLEGHVERWTVTTEGTLLPGVPRHYLRILPGRADTPYPAVEPNQGSVTIANLPPGAQNVFPAKEIVDAGFLELVRHGVRRPDDPIIVDSLKVVDAVLKVETPSGPCWRRYNHDGYGQGADGAAFVGWGQGRAWPLLTPMQPGDAPRVVSARGTLDVAENGSFRIESDCAVRFGLTLPAQDGKAAELSTMAMRGFLVSGGREILAFQTDPGAMVAARFTSDGR